MDTYFLSLAVILAGGLAPLLMYRQFNLMKTICIALIGVGCMIGLYFSLAHLLHQSAAASFSMPWFRFFTLSFKIDSISAFFLVPIFIISPVAAFYSFHYMENSAQSGRTAINYCFYAILVAAMALVASANNIVTFALAWEIMSLSSFFLVIYDFQNKATRQAGYLYFIFAQGGAMLLFAAFALIYTHTGSLDFTGISQIPATAKLIIFILAFIGFGSKAGVFPLHIWLPHAHPAAPSHVSAIMSGVMIKMGIYGIVRFYDLLGAASMTFGYIVLIVGMITGVLGVVYALGKQDMKKLLAYSSVENIGIILIGLGVGMIGIAADNQAMAFFGFAGAFMHVFNHSIFKSLLFMGAGAVLHKTHTRSINHLGGLLKRMPTTGKTFLAGSLAISGLPPFNGFVGEFLIYYGAFQGVGFHHSTFIVSMMAIISLAVIGGLATACFTKVVGLGFLGEPRSEVAANASEAGFTMKIAMIGLAASCLFIGIFPEFFVKLAALGIDDLQLIDAVSTATFIKLARNISLYAGLFCILLIVVTLLRKLFYLKKEIGHGPTWGCGFTRPTVRMQYTGTSYAASMVDFYRPFVPTNTVYSGIETIFPGQTNYQTTVDDGAETQIHQKIVKPIFKLLYQLRWIQHGNIQLYISYIIFAIVLLLLFM